MRALLAAGLLTTLALLALVPGASAQTCDDVKFSVYIDQTGALACGTADWLIIGGPSPIGLGAAYAGCYVWGYPPGFWVPNCS